MRVCDGVDGCLVLSPAGSDQVIHRCAIVSGTVCKEVFNDLPGINKRKRLLVAGGGALLQGFGSIHHAVAEPIYSAW